MGSRPIVNVTVFLLAAATTSCLSQPTTDQPVLKEALNDYFDGGFVAYALPGQGALFEPGTIIRYQKKAEVLVRSRESCFPLDFKETTEYSATVKWRTASNYSAALKLIVPQVATSLAADFERNNTQGLDLALGPLSTHTLQEGDVRDRQQDPGFPSHCSDEYGKGNILVLAVIGSKKITYRFSDAKSLESALQASAQKLNLGGQAKAERSSENQNAMDIVSDEVVWFGYMPYALGTPGKKSGDASELLLERLPVAKALELRRDSQ